MLTWATLGRGTDCERGMRSCIAASADQHVQELNAVRHGPVDHRLQNPPKGEIGGRRILQEQIKKLLRGGSVERIGYQLRTQRADLGREAPDRTHVVLNRS